MKKIFYTIITFLFTANTSLAQVEKVQPIRLQTEAMSSSAGFDSSQASATTLSDTIASLIKIFLGFLGIIFIVLIVYSGYNWMTAGGNEEKVTKARTTIFRAIIGLIITVSAYAITYFVFGALE